MFVKMLSLITCLVINADACTTMEEFEKAKADILNSPDTIDLKKIVKQYSDAVGTLHTFDETQEKNEQIYNSAFSPRSNKTKYYHGVCSAICVSPYGHIIVPTEYINGSSKIIFTVGQNHSKKNIEAKNRSENNTIYITEDDIELEIIKKNDRLTVLKPKTTSKKSFSYFKFSNRNELKKEDSIIHNGSIVIGKAQGDIFINDQNPKLENSEDNFSICARPIEVITTQTIDGITSLLLINKITGLGVLPENAGGPIINKFGELIGIAYWNNDSKNSCIFSNGFLASEAKDILRKTEPSLFNLEANKSLGVRVEDIFNTDNIPEPNKKNGVIVRGVELDSIAYAYGIRPNDIILKFNNKPLENAKTFINLEKIHEDDNTISLLVFRDKKLIEIEISKNNIVLNESKKHLPSYNGND